MLVITSEDDNGGAISLAFNNEIQVLDKNNNLLASHPVDENIASCLVSGNNLIYSTFDGHIISKKM